jgi:SPP1 gp7 family putative phage head morphogenesis protein
VSSNTFQIDAATRHQVFLQRFAGGQANLAQEQLLRLSDTIVARMRREPTEFQASRLSVMLNDINSIQQRFYPDFNADITQMALDLSANEAEFTVNMMDKAASVQFQLPTAEQMAQGVLRQGMDTPVGPGTLTMTEALGQFSNHKTREVLNLINDGILLGDTNQQIIRSVRELIGVKQSREADTLVRTIVNHTSSVARGETYKTNAGVLQGYEWVATLDSRTTLICAGRDGRVYQIGRGPMPPAHWNCRSTTVPVVDEALRIDDVTGERPSVGADGAEPVSAKSTYGGWLKKQPAAFQDEVLGPARGKLFREGGLSIDRFRDETGVTYTLEQLRELEPLAFQKAGINGDGN